MKDSPERRDGGEQFNIEIAHAELQEALTPLLEHARMSADGGYLSYDLPDGTSISVFRRQQGEASHNFIGVHEAPEYFEGPGGRPVVTQRHKGVTLDWMPGYQSMSDVAYELEVLTIDEKGRFRGAPQLTETQAALTKSPAEDIFTESSSLPYDASAHAELLQRLAEVEIRDRPRTPAEFSNEVGSILDVLGSEPVQLTENPRYYRRSGSFLCQKSKIILQQTRDVFNGRVTASSMEIQKNVGSTAERPIDSRILFTTTAGSNAIAAEYWSVSPSIDPVSGEVTEESSRAIETTYGMAGDIVVTNVRNMLEYVQHSAE